VFPRPARLRRACNPLAAQRRGPAQATSAMMAAAAEDDPPDRGGTGPEMRFGKYIRARFKGRGIVGRQVRSERSYRGGVASGVCCRGKRREQGVLTGGNVGNTGTRSPPAPLWRSGRFVSVCGRALAQTGDHQGRRRWPIRQVMLPGVLAGRTHCPDATPRNRPNGTTCLHPPEDVFGAENHGPDRDRNARISNANSG